MSPKDIIRRILSCLSMLCAAMPLVGYAQAPNITQQPQSQSALAGNFVSFTVAATGKTPLSYYWSFSGNALADGGRISGASTATLTISNIAGADAGPYQVVVSNRQGTAVSTPATLTVWQPPSITQPPQSQTAFLLSAVTLGVSAAGTAPLSYRWRFNGVPLSSGGRFAGADTPSLNLSNVQGGDYGPYSVVVTNAFGSVTSAVSVLSVVPVVGWGDDTYGQIDFTPDLTNAVAIDGGEYHSLVLRADGVIAGYTDVIQVAAGGLHDVALRSDGTVVAWGYDAQGQTDVPPGLSNVVAVAAGRHQSLALLADSTVVCWGAVGNPAFPLSNVVEISSDSGVHFDSALLVDGTVVEWDGSFLNQFVDAVSNIVAISGASQVIIGLESDGTVRTWCTDCPATQPITQTNIVAVGAGFGQVLTATADGQALAWGANDYGQANVPAGLGGVISASGGAYHSLALAGVGPPHITKWLPRKLTGISGRPVYLRMPSSGLRPLTYRWYRGGNLVAQGTNDILAFPQVHGSDAGDYSVIISNSFGSVTGRVTTLSVIVPPAITQQPLSQSVLFSNAVTFTVAVNDPGPLAYRWYFNGTPLGDNGRIVGSTGASLTISNVFTFDGGDYTVVVANSTFSTTSSVARLTVLVPASFTFKPQSQSALLGTNVIFSAAAEGTEPLFYQWYFENAPLTNSAHITGANSSALGLSAIQTNDAGHYVLVVSNAYGVASSGPVLLTVLVPPGITTQPVSQAVLLSSNVAFSVVAAGTPPLSYQWFFNGMPLSDSSRVSGSATSSLTISNAQSADAGIYTVIVADSAISVTSSVATLTVLVPASFTIQPQSQSALLGSNVAFSAVVVGTGPLFYQWYFENAPLTNSARVTGANSSALGLSAIQTNDAGHYVLVVSNAYGVATSDPVLLTVLVPPNITAQPASQTALVGSNVAFSVVAAGTPPFSYQWFFNGAPLSDAGRISGSATSNLTLSNAQSADAGGYSATITNLGGSITSSVAVLTVLQPPVILSQPAGCSVVPGLPASFNLSAGGTTPLSYQWQLNGTDIPGATNSSLTIPAVGQADYGLYQAVVSNVASAITSAPALLTFGNVAAWARNDSSQTVVPASLSNVLAVAGGISHSLALRGDGTIAAWGGNVYGQTNVPAGLTNAVAVASGANHSLALRADGTVVSWGINSGGATNVPASLSNVVAVAGGTLHSVALRADGTVISWGTFSSGKSVAAPAGLRQVAAIAANGSFTMALRADGTVVAWGDNTFGQTNIPARLTNVVAVAAGGAHGLALRQDGTVVAWGRNNFGQTNVPSNVTNVVAIAAGNAHSLALRADGTAIAWGYNFYTQTNTPAVLSNLVAIACGDSHNLAIVGDGRPLLLKPPVGGTFFAGRPLTLQVQAAGAAPLSYRWQHDSSDIPGATNATLFLASLASTDQGNYQVVVTNAVGVAVSLPVPVTVLDGVAPFVLSPMPLYQTNYFSSRVVLGPSIGGPGPLQYQWRFNGQVIPGATNSELVLDPVVTSNSGQYLLMVSNQFGALLTQPDYLTVVQVKAWGYFPLDAPASASNAVAVSTSAYQYMVLRPDGRVVVWGPQTYNPTPPSWATNVAAIACGFYHFVILRADGTFASWGTSESGVTNLPAGPNNVVAISASYNYTLALRADGTILGLGNNPYQGAVPTNATNVVGISAGYFHSLALRADGSIVAWGQNSYGEAAPPPGTGNTNFIAVAAGDFHNVALRADGTVVAWGQNRSGSTVVPAGLSNVVAVAAGSGHSAALLADGTVVTWGIYYQFPTSTITPSDLANVVQISGGGDHSMALFGTRAPYVTIQPINRTLFRGTNTTFVAKVAGPQPVNYQWLYNGAPIPGATNDNFSLTNLQLSQSGAYQLIATNAYGLTASVNAKLVVTIPLAQALDTTNLTWTSSSSAPWFGQAETTFDGIDAARSGAIGNSQESILQTTVIGPGQISWWWKVSSEQDFDILEFRIGGVSQVAISGEVGWEQRSLSVPAGSQTLQWRYAKDASFSDGQDAGWVDQVVFIPDPPVITRQPFDQTVNMGAQVFLQVLATGSPPLTYQWLQNDMPVGTGATLSIASATRTNGGSYVVRVSNPGGDKLSSNAVLKVLVPQRLGLPVSQPDGSLLLTSGDADGGLLSASDLTNFEAQVSSDLVNWMPVSNALTLTNGVLLLQDFGSTNHPYQFYRIIER